MSETSITPDEALSSSSIALARSAGIGTLAAQGGGVTAPPFKSFKHIVFPNVTVLSAIVTSRSWGRCLSDSGGHIGGRSGGPGSRGSFAVGTVPRGLSIVSLGTPRLRRTYEANKRCIMDRLLSLLLSAISVGISRGGASSCGAVSSATGFGFGVILPTDVSVFRGFSLLSLLPHWLGSPSHLRCGIRTPSSAIPHGLLQEK